MKAPFQGYTEDDILSLFAQLFEEAVYNLLFLKNVLSLEMYVWESGMSEPKIVYSCSLGSQDDNLSLHRQALIRFSGTSTESFEQKIDSFFMDFVSEAFLGKKFEKKSYSYFIVQGMASALSKIGIFATGAAKEYDLHLLPWASVAACISKVGPEGTMDGSDYLDYGEFVAIMIHLQTLSSEEHLVSTYSTRTAMATLNATSCWMQSCQTDDAMLNNVLQEVNIDQVCAI